MTITLVAVAAAIINVKAETHTVHFFNNCNFGTPYLRNETGDVLSTGQDYTINGPLVGAIAYLQTGNCGDNGENCTLLQTTLLNGASVTDISLIPPHAFSVPTGFGYYNGCDDEGGDCTSPDDCDVQVSCQADNVDLAITFCD
ncbi:hypothetical protein WOLCODRAFT_164149 [Wolfiporia cocos MD-104 SS10]|uniref:Glycopeptide n=1 Tax=Wolfiporia cocos (strain MD-104) TaxID=742152 RepID=A0A2H3JLA2_WOLCO|nr:hypothetical protein WOLCODRAFT_164149 [Wolfiporia cocos MD-104 SS10]